MTTFLFSSPFMLCKSVHASLVSKNPKHFPVIKCLQTTLPVSPNSGITHQTTDEILPKHDLKNSERITPVFDDGTSRIRSSSPYFDRSYGADESQPSNFTTIQLAQIARDLDSCGPNEDEIFRVLGNIGGSVFPHYPVIIMNNMTNSENVTLVRKCFQERLKPESTKESYMNSLMFFLNNKDLNNAEKMFNEMILNGFNPDAETFSTLIYLSHRQGLNEAAIQWFKKMLDFGVSPDSRTINHLISSYLRLGNHKEVLNIFELAKQGKLKLSGFVYASAIRSHFLQNDFKSLLSVYSEMMSLGVGLGRGAYDLLLETLSQTVKPCVLMSLQADMIRDGSISELTASHSLLRTYCNTRHINEALSLYKELKEKDAPLDLSHFDTLLTKCAEMGLVEEAVKIFEDMKNRGIKPSSKTSSAIVSAYSAIGDMHRAEEMLNEFNQAGVMPRNYTIVSLIKGYAKIRSVDGVVKTFNRMPEFGLEPDARIAFCLLRETARFQKGELRKIIECIRVSHPLLGSLLTMLVEGQDGEGIETKAKEFFEPVDPKYRAINCNHLVDFCYKINTPKFALKLFKLALWLGVYDDDIQNRSSSGWFLSLKQLSCGTAMAAIQLWISDLSKASDSGEELPPVIGIQSGEGRKKTRFDVWRAVKHHMKEIGAPFQEGDEGNHSLLSTNMAVETWLKAKKVVSESETTEPAPV